MHRLFTLQRAAHASPVAILVLLVVNAIPLVGVLFLGWDLPTIVALYWAENGVVGVFAFARIMTARGSRAARPEPPPPPPPGGRPVIQLNAQAAGCFMGGFFVVHYGVFWLVHGLFVWLFLPMAFAMLGGGGAGAAIGGGGAGAAIGGGYDPGNPFSSVVMPSVAIVLATVPFMFASHGVSFVLNWVLGGERDASTPAAEMAAPYARVVVLHLTILLGAFAVAFLGAPIWALVVMVGLKTAFDLGAHLAERRRAEGRAAGAGVALPVRTVTRTIR
ncbi:MAG: DUF6498-containing protein [Chloroflexota bacterium]